MTEIVETHLEAVAAVVVFSGPIYVQDVKYTRSILKYDDLRQLWPSYDPESQELMLRVRVDDVRVDASGHVLVLHVIQKHGVGTPYPKVLDILD